MDYVDDLHLQTFLLAFNEPEDQEQRQLVHLAEVQAKDQRTEEEQATLHKDAKALTESVIRQMWDERDEFSTRGDKDYSSAGATMD
jgi:hypothetical protein